MASGSHDAVTRAGEAFDPATSLDFAGGFHAGAKTHEMRTLAIALLGSLLLWNLPFAGVLLYPFKLLATWLHELSHGVAMIITGAGFDHVIIYRDTSGLAYAYTSVGSFGTAIIAAAGYMGTPLWGALLLVVTPTGRAARRALLVLAGLLVLTTILVVAPAPNGDRFGQWVTPAIGARMLV